MIRLFTNHNNRMNYAKTLHRLGVLLEQGYKMDDALAFMLIHVPDSMKQPLEQVKIALREGQEIHRAFSLFPIPSDIVAFLYFYQFHGQVSEGFIKAGELLKKRQEAKEQVQKLLRYPILLVWICFVVLLVLHQFVVPHFTTLFDTLGGEPPLLTTFVLQSLKAVPYVGFLFLFCLGALAGYLILSKKKWSPKRRMQFYLKVPFLSTMVQQVCTYFFSLQFGRLLLTGTSLQQALSIFEKQEHLPFMQQEAVSLKAELRLGVSLHTLIRKREYFTQELAFVIENGERTGYLGSDLENFSYLIYNEMDDKLKKFMDFLQPIVFLFIGGFIFILFLAIMLPMFQMISTIQ
ncbi:competence type IV pilus assembly protein ComGB [Bacillus sp. FJAT-45037]|uniref:competence type IV pilus assembly protein ComGB n=1 Tax=Bacillus sp. FJAT-45037 TaxID=2011007 RepID=UPI000C2486AD|nr:competence type IV pilus assembly protein ComGB [Bacillus sp. FJAT-45037]